MEEPYCVADTYAASRRGNVVSGPTFVTSKNVGTRAIRIIEIRVRLVAVPRYPAAGFAARTRTPSAAGVGVLARCRTSPFVSLIVRGGKLVEPVRGGPRRRVRSRSGSSSYGAHDTGAPVR